MNNFTFYTPTEFVFGKDSEFQIAEVVKKHGGSNLLLVFGGSSIFRSGLLDRIEDRLKKSNISYSRIGGGSVIDTAKAIAVGASYEGDFWDFFVGKVVPKRAVKVGVVLTIPAAAGSEGSGNSVITKVSTLQKLSLRTPELLRPVFAIMNPEITYTLPPHQTAAGIVDIMAHIMERYFSNTEGVELTDRLCEAMLQVIIKEALRVKAEPTNYEARANIMWAGTLAHNGLLGAGRKEDWASHFMEHEISALYGVIHGAGLAVVFPAWLKYAAEYNVNKIAQYAVRVWGVSTKGSKKEVALKGIELLESFLTSINMPITFKELGIEKPKIDEMVKKIHQNKGETIGNYLRLSAEETKSFYEKMI